MFELPECAILAGQINATLTGRTIRVGQLGNSPHKFVWYNRTPADFAQLTAGKRLGAARAQGRWLFIPLEPGFVLLLGECGGKMLYHPPGVKLPAKFHLCLRLTDGASFTVMTQMWGAMELYAAGAELERPGVKDMRPTPGAPEFTPEYFTTLIDGAGGSRSAKGLLTQEGLIPGLGNAIAQDILFRAGLHPRHPVIELTKSQRRKFHQAIVTTVETVTKQGGRYDEYDLYNQPGRYVRLMDKQSAGKPCPACGTRIQKIAYLGGACYFCPTCQS